MLNNSLKGKLEQRYIQNEPIVIEEASNIVPFEKNEQKVISVVPEFAISMAEAKERLHLLQEFVHSMMVEGVDYGIIPNSNKPTLFKPGAEKLTDIYGLSKEIVVLNREEDWEKGIFHYEVKAILRNKRTGLIEAEGVGSANNKEKKFSTQHSFSLVNTVLKIAKKRALIDAVLSATRTSSLFTQDIEDLDNSDLPNSTKNSYVPVEQRNKSSFSSSHSNQQKANNSFRPVTKNQLNKIQSIVEQKSIPVNEVKNFISERYRIHESKNLSLNQADDFIKFLIKY